MMLSEKIDIPEDVRNQVMTHLKMTREMKVAMTAAIADIKGLRSDSKITEPKSVVEYKGLNNVDMREKAPLQAIDKFLRIHGLEYTLDTLTEESVVTGQSRGADLETLVFLNQLALVSG
jgi:hypothetical protein